MRSRKRSKEVERYRENLVRKKERETGKMRKVWMERGEKSRERERERKKEREKSRE